MKNTLISLFLIFITTNMHAADTCPLMIGEENDPEETVTIEGKTLDFCCGSCVSKFEENTAYYIKASKALYDKFTQEERDKLGVEKVKLLEQLRCPIYNDRIVNPNSPTAEYKGTTIYFWSTSALRRWTRDPDRYYEQAKAAGVLK